MTQLATEIRVTVECPNCHGKGFVQVPTTKCFLPCFVCDEDGRIDGDDPLAQGADSGSNTS